MTPELARMLDHLRAGDVVTVTRLDRLARTTRDLLNVAEQIKDIGAGLRSLAEPWADTTSAAGQMVLTVFAGIAHYAKRGIMRSRAVRVYVYQSL
jgi:DNA invertase Pin-like site-specific DNA recombinase